VIPRDHLALVAAPVVANVDLPIGSGGDRLGERAAFCLSAGQQPDRAAIGAWYPDRADPTTGGAVRRVEACLPGLAA
jgi:hypothetical protein